MQDYKIRTIGRHQIAVHTKDSFRIMLPKNERIKSNLPLDMDIATLAKYLSKEQEPFPLLLRWELTSRCTLNCPFCYIHQHVQTSDMTWKEAKPLIDELISKGMLFITLTGGECTMIQDFVPIYTYLRQQGVLVKVYSNGVAWRPEIWEVFQQYKPRRVEITLYSPIREDSRAYETLLRLQKEKIPVLAKMTVTKQNKYWYDDWKNWCQYHNIPFQVDCRIHDAYDGKKTSDYNLLPEEKAEIMKEQMKKTQIQISNPTCFSCHAGTSSFLIDSRRNLRICHRLMSPKVSLQEYTLDEAIRALFVHVFKYKGKPIKGCISCEGKNICPVCFADCGKDARVNSKVCKETQEIWKYIKMSL